MLYFFGLRPNSAMAFGGVVLSLPGLIAEGEALRGQLLAAGLLLLLSVIWNIASHGLVRTR